MKPPSGQGLDELTEYDFQKENGVLDFLDEHLHYTYSVWPSSRAVKGNVNMNFYQKPIYNYKLECELSTEKSLAMFQTLTDDSYQTVYYW